MYGVTVEGLSRMSSLLPPNSERDHSGNYNGSSIDLTFQIFDYCENILALIVIYL